MADIEVQLKNTLRSLRIKLGYTQEESAKMLGISAVTLRAWESESGNITFDCIKKIERIYNTRQEYIFFGNEAEFAKLLRGSSVIPPPKKVAGVLVAIYATNYFITICANLILFQGIQA